MLLLKTPATGRRLGNIVTMVHLGAMMTTDVVLLLIVTELRLLIIGLLMTLLIAMALHHLHPMEDLIATTDGLVTGILSILLPRDLCVHRVLRLLVIVMSTIGFRLLGKELISQRKWC
jgi:hypothetical protein